MAIQIQLRQGTTTEHSTFTGAVGEVTVDTTKKALVLHDGVTKGGRTLPHLDTSGKIPIDQIPADQLPDATTTAKGVVKLNKTITSTSNSEALAASQGKVLSDQAFGVEQTWQNVTSSRGSYITYTNTTRRPISVFLKTSASSPPASILVSIKVGALEILNTTSSGNETYFFVVPSGMTYGVDISGAYTQTWMELR